MKTRQYVTAETLTRRQMKARQYVTPETLTLKERQSLLLALRGLLSQRRMAAVYSRLLLSLCLPHQESKPFFSGLIDTMADVVVF